MSLQRKRKGVSLIPMTPTFSGKESGYETRTLIQPTSMVTGSSHSDGTNMSYKIFSVVDSMSL